MHHELFSHRVPDSMSDDAAALLEPLSVALWACQKGGVTGREGRGPASRCVGAAHDLLGPGAPPATRRHPVLATTFSAPAASAELRRDGATYRFRVQVGAAR